MEAEYSVISLVVPRVRIESGAGLQFNYLSYFLFSCFLLSLVNLISSLPNEDLRKIESLFYFNERDQAVIDKASWDAGSVGLP